MATSLQNSFFIGWDVGGWNCDKNPKSRDAIVILDTHLVVVGTPWRGNLRESINKSISTRAFIGEIFQLCHVNEFSDTGHITLAIDTPLGFSTEFIRLVTALKSEQSPGDVSALNPYLFRQTERFLFNKYHLTPMSAIKDMIGSQATKGMHVLAKFAPIVTGCGVWTNGGLLTAIETYPSACKGSAIIDDLRQQVENKYTLTQDEKDALTCALVASLFANNPDQLIPSDASVPLSEGWIWLPTDIKSA